MCFLGWILKCICNTSLRFYPRLYKSHCLPVGQGILSNFSSGARPSVGPVLSQITHDFLFVFFHLFINNFQWYFINQQQFSKMTEENSELLAFQRLNNLNPNSATYFKHFLRVCLKHSLSVQGGGYFVKVFCSVIFFVFQNHQNTHYLLNITFTRVPTAEMWWHLSNVKVIQRIWQVFLQDQNFP